MSLSTPYRERIASLLQELGISSSYAEVSGMQLHEEALDLCPVGQDMYGRDQRLTPPPAAAWQLMREAAASEGVELLLVSGFRSVDRQREIWQRKLASGQTVAQILTVNAAPGYSEHHTGRAIDIAEAGQPPLTEEFETTAAFAWLAGNADRFGFTMSYPRNNPYGVIYEPWHWALTSQS